MFDSEMLKKIYGDKCDDRMVSHFKVIEDSKPTVAIVEKHSENPMDAILAKLDEITARLEKVEGRING